MTPQEAQAELARRELARRQQQRQQARPLTATDAVLAVNPLTAGIWALDRAAQNPTSRVGSFASGFRDAATFSFGDEAAGAQAGVQALIQGRTPQQAAEAMTAATANDRANQETALRTHPLSNTAGLLAGSVLPTIGVGSLGTAATRAGRFARSFGSGAAAAGIYGVGSGQTAEERATLGAQGAALGGALGAGFQGVAEAAPAIGRAFRNVTGLPDYRGQGVAQTAADDLMRTAQANRSLGVQTPDDLARIMDEAAQRDPQMMVAEALGQQGTQRLAFLARARGETGQRVEDFVTQRNRNQPAVLEETFLRSPVSGDALEQQVREQWRTRGPELYGPLLSARPQMANLRAFVQLRNSPLFQHRAVQSAWRRAGEMIRDDIALGRIPEGAANSIRHQLHYAKVALDEMIEDPTRLEPGLRNMNNASIAAARDGLLLRMEAIIPGYNAARQEMADIGSARRAIDAGRQAFTRQRFASDEALQRYVAGLSAGERPYFQAGVEDWISNRIAEAGRDGRRNVAAALLNDRFQNRLRVAFGQEADAMLQRARTQAAMFDSGQRVRPTTGSITSNMALEAGDLAAPRRPTVSNVLDEAWRYGWEAVTGPGGERHRNLMGRVYSAPVGEFRRRQGGLLSRAQQEAERRARRRALALTHNAYYSGLGSAGVVGRQEDY